MEQRWKVWRWAWVLSTLCCVSLSTLPPSLGFRILLVQQRGRWASVAGLLCSDTLHLASCMGAGGALLGLWSVQHTPQRIRISMHHDG